MPELIAQKLKADDYLRDFASQTDEVWLSSLINRILDTHKVPGAAILNGMYNEFLAINGLTNAKTHALLADTTEVFPRNAPAETSGFCIKSLVHQRGVNALVNGASISFHPKLTVIYGQNGTGKSGFVKILKKVAGSRTQEDIWQNVHKAQTRNQCSATIVYESAGKENTCQWSAQTGIAPFTKAAIFDGKCVPIYLTKSLDFSYQPYGFELFEIISQSLQELQKRLTSDVQNAENDKPGVEDLFSKGTVIGEFVASITSATTIGSLYTLPVWDKKAKRTLTKHEKEKRGLQNLDQQSELLRTRLQKIKALQQTLEEVESELSSANIKTYAQLVKKFNLLRRKRATKKGKTLEDYEIPDKDSDEWERFIHAGEEYINILQRDDYPTDGDHCIYCRQKLTGTAIKLIELYRALFLEKESTEFEEIVGEVSEKINDLETTTFGDAFAYEQADFAKLLPPKIIAGSFRSMKDADARIQAIVTCLKTKKIPKIKSLNVRGLLAGIKTARGKIETEMAELLKAKANLQTRFKQLTAAITELQDIQKFAKQRCQIEKLVRLEQWIVKANRLLPSKLNTKPITDLGRKAWKELVSDSFKGRFRTEVENLNAPEVKLDFHGEYGAQMREKSLEGLSQIDQLLSEGEQKAVALADFFTELSVQNQKTPVIFDDPATSFDHERKEKIAKRIVEESEKRQVIVFTHDLMFASYMYERVENPVKGVIDPTKAAFHDLRSEKNQSGLVTENYYHGSVKFDPYIQRIDHKIASMGKLDRADQDEAIGTTYSMLRRAIEKAVEERIFGGVMIRWTDQIQMHNAPRASLSREKLNQAKALHEEFSRFIEAHNQSNEMIQHSVPDVVKLRKDLQKVKDIALR